MNNSKTLKLIPIMFCFFAMGFVDLVGTASNYVKADLHLSDTTANVFPSLVFFWFLIFSVPTGMLMNKIGRKKTVLLSLVITVFSLLLPIFGQSYGLMLVSFSLLGIGNALMQTSINPLVMTVMQGGNMAATFTFGQFIKAIASFLAPYIAMWGAMADIPSFGLGWRVLFPIYMVIGVTASLLLASTPIEEDKTEGKASSFVECFQLLGKPIVLFSFFGIMCHVGIDVGTNATENTDGTFGHTTQRSHLLNFAVFHLPYHRLPYGLVLPSHDEDETFLHHLRYSYGIEHVRTVRSKQQSRSLHSHCTCRLRQQQHLLNGAGTCLGECAREAERSERTHDNGALRWYYLPTAHGSCERQQRASRCCAGHGNRCTLPFHVYS